MQNLFVLGGKNPENKQFSVTFVVEEPNIHFSHYDTPWLSHLGEMQISTVVTVRRKLKEIIPIQRGESRSWIVTPLLG
jgi:hypothetical protein